MSGNSPAYINDDDAEVVEGGGQILQAFFTGNGVENTVMSVKVIISYLLKINL